MRTRAVVVIAALVSAGALGALAPIASASPQAKVPPVCVSHPLPHHLNVQAGYCP
jgi:ABC-type sugar transport system substrate-binding protein